MYNIKADRTPSEEKLFHYHSSILSFGELYYQLTWLGYSIPSKWFGNKSTTNKQPRIEVPIFYEDARGQQRTSGMHYVLLPHEILGTFYQFEAADLMMKLTGGPGVSWMQSFRGALGNSRYIYILILPSWLHWGFGGVLVAWANYRMVSQSPYSQSHMVAPSLMSETYKNGWTTELRITTKLTYTFWMFVHSLPQFKTSILSCSGDWSQLCHTLSSLRGWGWK